jgi:hypothetical protein
LEITKLNSIAMSFDGTSVTAASDGLFAPGFLPTATRRGSERGLLARR